MTTLLALLPLAALLSAGELVPAPTDVTGTARGANAVAFDPAAPGRVDAFELALRQRFGAGHAGLGAWAVAGVVPLGDGTLYGGYEWQELMSTTPSGQRSTVGLALAVLPRTYFGVSYHRLRVANLDKGVGSVDAGLLCEAAPWLTLSAGVDALNAPTESGVSLPRALRLGLAVRPWGGAPWLTLGADSRLTRGAAGAAGSTDAWSLADSRAVVDVSAWEGVHALASYSRQPRGQEVWVGLGVDLFGVEVRSSHRLDRATGINQTFLSETFRAAPSEIAVPPPTRTIEVPLDGDLEEPSAGLFHAGKAIPTVVLRLDALARDATVDTVLLSLGRLKVGMGTIDELRAAIGRLRAAHKKVIATLRGADDKTYMVAAAAERIRLDPLTDVNLDGFAVTASYFAATFAKLGIRFDAVGVGRFKSGPDALTHTAARPEDREVQEEILALAYATLTGALQQDRHLSADNVTAVLKQGMFTAQEALTAGLVDELTQPADLQVSPANEPRGDAYALETRPSRQWGAQPIVAVVPVVGTIVMHSGDNPLPGATADARDIVRQLVAADTDRRVVGVVLRINSPGGDVYASEVIWRAVRRVAAHKPVVASMGDVAASGGYYIAAPAGAIFAAPNTITGSIGIFTVKADLEGFLALLAVHTQTYKAGERADWESVTHPLRDEDRLRVRHSLENFYDAFVARVALGRHMPDAQVRQLAEGRVYTGKRAHALGLVDQLGDLSDAVTWVREQAHLDADTLVTVDIPDKAGGWPALVNRMVAAPTPSLGLLTTLTADVERRVEALSGRAMALLPWSYAVSP